MNTLKHASVARLRGQLGGRIIRPPDARPTDASVWLLCALHAEKERAVAAMRHASAARLEELREDIAAADRLLAPATASDGGTVMTDSAAPKATPKAWFGLFCVLGLIATACWYAQGATGLPTGAMAGFGEVFAIMAVLVLPVAIYLVPTTIAANRKHNNTAAIAVLNLLFGWTFIGWGIALIWATTNKVRAAAKD